MEGPLGAGVARTRVARWQVATSAGEQGGKWARLQGHKFYMHIDSILFSTIYSNTVSVLVLAQRR